MDQNDFSKEHTLITKGLLVIMLLVHHVLFPESVTIYGIKTIIPNVELVNRIIMFLWVCVAGFVFLSAYGMTMSFKEQKDSAPKYLFILSFRRLVKLLSGVVAIYILGGLYRQFVMRQSMRELYGNLGIFGTALRMLIDMLGMADYVGTPTINVTWWYLSYAVMMILAMPFIYMMYQKFRYFMIPAGCLLPYILLKGALNFFMLLPAVLFGTAFAYEDWFKRLGTGRKAVKTVICFAIFYMGYKMSYHMGRYYSVILSFSIPCIVYLFISRIPILRDLLKLIGKNAMNIFLTHTFIYCYFYTDFIYSFHYSWLIVTVLLAFSLGLSIVIELIKKCTGYNRLADKILCAYDRKWDKVSQS